MKRPSIVRGSHEFTLHDRTNGPEIVWNNDQVVKPTITYDTFDELPVALIFDSHNDEPIITVRFDKEGRVTSWWHHLAGVELKR